MYVVAVMKMGKIVLRVGIEPTSLAFWASVILHHIGSLMSPPYPRLPVYAAQRSVQTTTYIYIYISTVSDYFQSVYISMFSSIFCTCELSHLHKVLPSGGIHL